MSNTRRLAILKIDRAFIESPDDRLPLVAELGLPEDCRILAMSTDYFFDTGDVALKIEHHSLPEVKPGELLPIVYSGWVDGKFAGFVNSPGHLTGRRVFRIHPYLKA